MPTDSARPDERVAELEARANRWRNECIAERNVSSNLAEQVAKRGIALKRLEARLARYESLPEVTEEMLGAVDDEIRDPLVPHIATWPKTKVLLRALRDVQKERSV